MDNTKGVQLTQDEVQALIQYRARQIANSSPEWSKYIERLRYLNKRLQDYEEDNKQNEQEPPVEAKSW